MMDAPAIWLPPKPAIIRPAEPTLLKPLVAIPFLAPIGWRGVVGDIAVTDDGDAQSSSGAGTATLTFNSQTSTGPHSVIGITWHKATTTTTLSSATWGGSSMSILEQIAYDPGNDCIHCAICIIAGAQTGNIVLNFAATITDAEITKLSLSNLQSMTAVDTDEESASAGGSDLDSLTTPGTGGVRLAVLMNLGSATAVTWSNASEVSDLSVTSGAESWRHSMAYDLGDDSGAIAGNGGSNDEAHVGVSLR